MLVFLTLPFALIGGVFGAVWGGGVLSLGSLVGFVTVLGIALSAAHSAPVTGRRGYGVFRM